MILRLFLRGELSGKKVFEENGHGVITLKPYNGEVAGYRYRSESGPFQRHRLRFIYAAPGGNTMMTGPMGLVRAAQYWISTKSQTLEGIEQSA